MTGTATTATTPASMGNRPVLTYERGTVRSGAYALYRPENDATVWQLSGPDFEWPAALREMIPADAVSDGHEFDPDNDPHQAVEWFVCSKSAAS